METKFTPGPWKIGSDSDFEEFLSITTDEREGVLVPCCHVECNFSGNFELEQQANARLIAAAPEMYELLDRLCAAMDEEADNPNPKVTVGQVLFGVCASFEDLRERINA